MKAHQRPVSSYLQPPEVPAAALHVEWHEVRRRARRAKQVRVAVPVVALALVASVGGVVLSRPPLVEAGAQVRTLAAASTARLDDGSSFTVHEGSTLGVESVGADEVVLELASGSATFEVSKRPSRSFRVRAGEVEVRVIGTRFSVRRAQETVEVFVQRGIVEVRHHEAVMRLTAGMQWSSRPALSQLAPSAEPEHDEAPPDERASLEPAHEQSTHEQSTHEQMKHEQVTHEPLTQDEPKRSSGVHRRRPAPSSAPAPGGSAALPPPIRSELPLNPREATPAQVAPSDAFGLAMQARAAGQTREAIAGFQLVCERWPSSAYAPMSAFEWGRLALDAQNDPRQAARAFQRTLELATSGSLIEDASARLVEAYARYDDDACRRARADYLQRFPTGPHRRIVTQACPP